MPGDQVPTTLDLPVGPPRFREIPGAASVALASVLSKDGGDARVIGVFPTAVYIDTEDNGDTDDTVIAVITRDAVRLPNAIVVPVSSTQRPFDHVDVRSVASVARGTVRIGPLSVPATRWWDARVRPAVIDRTVIARNLAVLGRLLAGAPRHPGVPVPPGLVEALRSCDLAAIRTQARDLVGLGPGLTPSGDDILAGALAAFRVFGPAEAADSLAATVVPLVAGRTTGLSATLLRLAADGHVSGEAARLLYAVAGREALAPAVDALLSVGHTSGADVAAGLQAGTAAAIGIAAAVVAGGANR